MSKSMFQTAVAISLFACAAALGGEPVSPPKPAPRAIVLPDHCNTPDAMAVLGDGSIILSVPNFTDPSSPGVLMRIDASDRVSLFCKLPPHPETGHAFPMGIRQAPSGDLYVADCQFMDDRPKNSRLLCVRVVDGKAGAVEVVASGFEVANGVAIRGDFVYMTDSATGKNEAGDVISSVFCFRLNDRNVRVELDGRDPHLLATMTTLSREIPVGADGIDFDEAGSLYVANCGDGLIEKFTLRGASEVASRKVLTAPGQLKSADGLFYDRATRRLYVADILANAVRTVDLQGAVATVAECGDNDGADGKLDGPSEAVVRGAEVIAANFDRVFPGSVNTHSEPPCTLSVLPRAPAAP